MKKRVHEEISAFFDGESKDPESVGRLIRDSGDAAREHEALARLSGRLRELKTPEVHPAFARRVIAALEEQPVQQRISWRFYVAATTAAAAVLVGMFSLMSARVTTNTRPERGASSIASIQPAAVPARALDENTLLAELDRRVTQDRTVEQIVSARFGNSPEPSDIYSDRLIAAVAGSKGAAAAGEAIAHGVDFRSRLQYLDNEQSAELKKMLTASVKEALEG